MHFSAHGSRIATPNWASWIYGNRENHSLNRLLSLHLFLSTSYNYHLPPSSKRNGTLLRHLLHRIQNQESNQQAKSLLRSSPSKQTFKSLSSPPSLRHLRSLPHKADRISTIHTLFMYSPHVTPFRNQLPLSLQTFRTPRKPCSRYSSSNG